MPPERSTISQTTQIGVETALGVTVPATKKLLSMGLTPNPQADIADFRPSGMKYPTVQALGREWAVAPVTGQPTYSELIYALSSVLTRVNPTTPGGGTNSRRWTYNPDSSNEDNPVTYTVEHGSDVYNDRFGSGLFTELVIPFSRQNVTLSGSVMLQAISSGVARTGNEVISITLGAATAGTFTLTFGAQTTGAIQWNATAAQVQTALEALSTIGVGNIKCSGGPLPGTDVTAEFIRALGGTDVGTVTITGTGLTGGTPAVAVVTPGAPVTSIPLVPILGKQLRVYMDPLVANIGTTKLLRVLNGEIRIRNRFGPVWTVDADNPSWVNFVEIEPTVELMLRMVANSEGMALINAMRDGSTRFVRVEAVGDMIEAAIPYRFRFDIAGKVVSPPNSADADGVWSAEWTLRANHDPTWNKAYSVELTNAQTAL